MLDIDGLCYYCRASSIDHYGDFVMGHIKLESFVVHNGNWKATLSTKRFFIKKHILAAGTFDVQPSALPAHFSYVSEVNVSEGSVKAAVFKGWRVFYNGQ